jgi:uncharacterized protein with HEPN domain
VTHQYFGVDEETVWDIVRNQIPGLLEVVKRMLEEKQDSSN